MASVSLGILLCCILGVAEKAPSEELSLAERIARLQRGIEADEAHLSTLEAKLLEHDREYQAAGEEFQRLDARLQEDKKTFEVAQLSSNADAVEKLGAALKDLEKKWQLAHQRFELAIKARKTAQEQIAELQAKIDRDRQALQRMASPEKPAPKAPAPPTSPPAPAPAAPTEATASPAMPGLPALPSSAGPASEAAKEAPTSDTAKAPPSQELRHAQEDAAKAEAEAEQAEQEVEEVSERLVALDKNIALEQEARLAIRQKEDNTEQTLESLSEELRKAAQQAAPHAVIQTIQDKMRDAQQRLHEARAELRQRADQLDKFHAERASLLSEQLAVAQQAAEKRQQALEAQENLKAIQNPFAPHNLLPWLAEKGPKLLLILIVVLVLRVVIKGATLHIVTFLTRHDPNGRKKDREKRANTLVGVFHNTCVTVLYVGAVLMFLDIVGIPITPLLGGAAVVGLAVAFAAQNLIKDYFCGFMILLEDQYGINDVITIGGVTGFVERITLRITVLRDFDAVHFIPHGQITTVSNLTHKWSRAVFDIGVAYKEDVDRVMGILVELACEMRKDPHYGRLILEDPEMLGVDKFGDSAVMIKFFLKTKPLEQWPVKRELLRRIKRRFDELGIEIPFPHHTVYHRYEDGAATERPSRFGEEHSA